MLYLPTSIASQPGVAIRDWEHQARNKGDTGSQSLPAMNLHEGGALGRSLSLA